MVDVLLRTLPSGEEWALSLPAVPSAGDWLESAGVVVTVDTVLYRPGAVLLVGHAVSAGLAGERLHAPAGKGD